MLRIKSRLETVLGTDGWRFSNWLLITPDEDVLRRFALLIHLENLSSQSK